MVNTSRFINNGQIENRASALWSIEIKAVVINDNLILNRGLLDIDPGGTLENSGDVLVADSGILIVNGRLLNYGQGGAPVIISGGTLGGSGIIEGLSLIHI